MLLREFFAKQFEPIFLLGRSERTVSLYGTTLNNLDRFLSRPATMRDLTDDTLARYLHWFLAQPRGRSKHSANKEHANITAIWRFACRRYPEGANAPYVRNWPTVNRLAAPEDDPLAWVRPDLGKLFHALENETGTIAGIPAADWWTALHLVIWDSTERIGAAMELQWMYIDLDTRWVRFRAVTRKGKRKGKTRRFHPDTIKALRHIKGNRGPSDRVFPWPFSATYLWYRYTRILRKAGLPHDSKSKFHRMRKSVASHGTAAGLDPTKLLGHSSPKVTVKYLDPTIVTEPQVCDMVFRPNMPPPESSSG